MLREKMPVFKSKIIITASIVIIICIVWIAALSVGLNHAKPYIITHVKDVSSFVVEPVYIEVEKSVPAEQPLQTTATIQPVYVETQIHVPLEVPVSLKDWDSPEQLREFLKNDDTDRRIVFTADSQGQIPLNGQCEDFALQLRDRAMVAGMYLSIEVLHPKEYEKWYGQTPRPDRYHAICMARIDNEFWYIEPTNDNCWMALYLD